MIDMKKELYCGFDIAEFNRICDTLDNLKIMYTHKVVDCITPSYMAGELSGVRTSSKTTMTKQYYVYVSGSNFEKAKMLIKKGMIG